MDPKLLILDLDETLIFSTTERLERQEDFRIAEYFVYKRPHLDAFLQFATSTFEVAVWTSPTPSYAKLAVRGLFGNNHALRFVWARDRCTQRTDMEMRRQYWTKDLRKVKRLGFDLSQIIVVDDTPEKLQRSYGNHVRVNPFEGDLTDAELPDLQAFLEFVKDVDNVRTVEKRGWRGMRKT